MFICTSLSQNFYPRSPRGERQVRPLPPIVMEDISIHAPREGSDAGGFLFLVLLIRFLSTLPARGATTSAIFDKRKERISIHAPREGSDNADATKLGRGLYFYPRSPRGERHRIKAVRDFGCVFLSTLPARGATQQLEASHWTGGISIHAPREGSDVVLDGHRLVHQGDFYPRSPRGERRGKLTGPPSRPADFYPRSPRGERHISEIVQNPANKISIHAPREGSDCLRKSPLIQVNTFLSTLPARGATWCSCR